MTAMLEEMGAEAALDSQFLEVWIALCDARNQIEMLSVLLEDLGPREILACLPPIQRARTAVNSGLNELNRLEKTEAGR